MTFPIFKRGIAYLAILIVSVLSLFSLYQPVPFAQAEDKFTPEAGKRQNAKRAAIDELKKKSINAAPETKGVADPTGACYDNMNKLIPEIKFNDRKNFTKLLDIQRQIKRINDAIKNGGILFSPDGSSDKVTREKLNEMLAKENELLDEAKYSIGHTQKELDEMAARAVQVEIGSYEKPIICPEKGIYSVTQDDKMRYNVKCSVHGSSEELYSKLYEKSMKNSDPVKFCRGNISAIIGACEQYCIEYGVPGEWNLEMLIEEGYLQGKCVCPAGGVYSVKGGPGKIFSCSCSIHK